MPIGSRYEGEYRDPYKGFNFIIELVGEGEVAACRKMSGLSANVNVIEFRAGNSSFTNVERSCGRTEYEAVTLENGKTDDIMFERWANQLITWENRPLRVISPDYRKQVLIKIRRDNGTIGLQYLLHRAWVTKYTAFSDLAADGNDTLIETLEITHEGFERQTVESGGEGEEEGEGEEA